MIQYRKNKKEAKMNINNLKNKINLTLVLVMICASFGLATNAVVKNEVKQPVKVQKPVTLKTAETPVYQEVSSLAVVANPAKYLNKHIKIKAKFDKFSTLGLDYKPAYRSSEKYITFLIKRDDVTDHTIPLSELKNFLPRDIAEKYIDLNSGDEIEYSGVVFSNALGDAWVDVEKFVVLSKKPKDNKK